MATPAKDDSKADDYYDTIHRSTWTRRTTGLFAGATLGAAYGVIVGLVAAFLPYILGTLAVPGLVSTAPVTLPALGAIGTSIGLFSGVLALIGVAIGADVGANSASIAVGLAEKEKKEKAENATEVSSAKDPLGKDGKASPIFIWKAAPVLVPLFAAFGALIATNPFTASVVASLSFFGGAFVPHSIAAVTASSILFATGGALMAFKNSIITDKLSNFYMGVFDGAVFDGITGGMFKNEPEKSPALASHQPVGPAKTADAIIAAEEEQPAKSFSSEKLRFSMQGLIEKTEERPAEQPVATR